MAFNNTLNVMNTNGVGVVNRFRQVFAQKNGNASGETSRQAKSTVAIHGNMLNLTVDTTSYFFYADLGRGKTVNSGKGLVRPRIRKWIDQKHIVPPRGMSKDQLAYFITRKIHREGYKGKFYVKDVITPEFEKHFTDELADALLKDLVF